MFGLKSLQAALNPLTPVQQAAAPFFPSALASPALVFATRLRKEVQPLFNAGFGF
jgi:hypothetical protein